jgi:hypothetical protein
MILGIDPGTTESGWVHYDNDAGGKAHTNSLTTTGSASGRRYTDHPEA